MAIVGFQNSVQPVSLKPYAAYRPIALQPMQSITISQPAPVCYCDVYFGGNYVETLTSTTAYKDGMLSPYYWIFDIQTSIQRYLSYSMMPFSGSGISSTAADATGTKGSSVVECYCKFRASTIDANGFIQEDGIAGTDGYASNSFIVVNSVLQHEDNQDLEAHLLSFQNYYDPASPTKYEILPLSHRISDVVCKNDYDWFPVMLILNAFTTGTQTFAIGIDYKLKNGTSGSATTQFNIPIQTGIPYRLSTGLIQLRQLSWYLLNYPSMTATSVAWDDITEYSVSIIYNNGLSADLCFQTPKFSTVSCNCRKERLRIRFLNYLGFFDCVNFSEIDGSLITTSEQWQKALKYPLVKSDGGYKRFNVKSNEKLTVSTCAYGEKHQEWLKELFDSPIAFIEWAGGQGQPIDNIPIIISDGEFQVRKSEGRYEYVTQLTIQMANENIRQRN